MFNIVLQEIWDFNITFQDWKGSNMLNALGEIFDPALKFRLLKKGSVEGEVLTDEKSKEPNPQWGVIPGSILYRGTIADLEDQNVEIVAYDVDLFVLERVGSVVVPLKGLSDHGYLKAEIKAALSRQNKIRLRVEKKKVSEVKFKVEGRVNIGIKPKYRQAGEVMVISSSEVYLCVGIGKVEKLLGPSDRDSYNTYVDVEWGGMIKKTRTLVETVQPNFNEILMFHIPMKSSERRDEAKLKKKLRDEFMNKYVLRINLWHEDEDQNSENLGTCDFFLSELFPCEKQEVSYFYDDENKLLHFKAKQYNGKRKLISHIKNAESLLNLQVWLMPEVPLLNEFKELPSKIEDNFPEELKSLIAGQEKSILYQRWIERIRNNFRVKPLSEERWRIFSKFVFLDDQYKKRHFLSLFIAKLSPPVYLNTVNQDLDVAKDLKALKKKKLNRMNSMQSLGGAGNGNKNEKTAKSDGETTREESTNSKRKGSAQSKKENNEIMKNKKKKRLEFEDDQFTLPPKERKKIKKMTKDSRYRNKVFTLPEIVHFIKCIPYSKNPNHMLWSTPDFFFTSKRGDVEEHALAVASYFIGSVTEFQNDYIQKLQEEEVAKLKKKLSPKDKIKKKLDTLDPFTMENRCFLCLGTLKGTNNFHIWVMTLDRNFETVTFWELRNGKKYELKGRILPEEKQKLVELLCPTLEAFKNVIVENVMRFRKKRNHGIKFDKMVKGPLDIVQHYWPKEFSSNLGLVPAKTSTSPKIKVMKAKKKLEKRDSIKKSDNKEGPAENYPEVDEGDGNEKEEYDVLNANIVEKIVELNELGQLLRNKQMKDIGGENALDTKLRNLLRRGDEFGADGKSNQKDGVTKDAFIKEQERQMQAKEEARPDKHLKEITEFLVGDTLAENPDLPYASIDMIANHKNIWANLRCADPRYIHYHIHRSEDWYPFLQFTDSDNVEHTWNKPLEVFYRAKNLAVAATLNAVEVLQNEILKEIRVGITAARNAQSLSTKWRPQNDKTLTLLSKYLTMMENSECQRLNLDKLRKLEEQWRKKMLKLIPRNFLFKTRHMFFNERLGSKIRDLILENCQSIYLIKEKRSVFALCVRVFPLPQGVNSIRVMLAAFYAKPQEFKEDGRLEQLKKKRIDQNNDQGGVKDDDEEDEEEENEDAEDAPLKKDRAEDADTELNVSQNRIALDAEERKSNIFTRKK